MDLPIGYNPLDTLNSNVTQPTGISTYSGNPVYVVNSNGMMTKCSTPAPFPYDLSSCTVITTPTGFPSDAYGLGMNQTVSVTYYTVNKLSNSISLCTDPGNSGNITSCSAAGGSNFNQPVAITSTRQTNYILVANAGDSTITRCAVSAVNGTLSGCVHTGGSSFNQPSTIFEERDSGYAYITNKGDNTVTICSGSNGTLTNCSRVSYGFFDPVGIVLWDPCG